MSVCCARTYVYICSSIADVQYMLIDGLFGRNDSQAGGCLMFTQNIIIIIGASLLYVCWSILSCTADYAYGKSFNLKFISLGVCFAK